MVVENSVVPLVLIALLNLVVLVEVDLRQVPLVVRLMELLMVLLMVLRVVLLMVLLVVLVRVLLVVLEL